MFRWDLCLFQLCQSCHVFLLKKHLPAMTSESLMSRWLGHTTVGWWVLAIMAAECWWRRSGWLITLSLTFVENKQSVISNNDQSNLTFDERQIAHVQITTWWLANYYTILRTILVFWTITSCRNSCLQSPWVFHKSHPKETFLCFKVHNFSSNS